MNDAAARPWRQCLEIVLHLCSDHEHVSAGLRYALIVSKLYHNAHRHHHHTPTPHTTNTNTTTNNNTNTTNTTNKYKYRYKYKYNSYQQRTSSSDIGNTTGKYFWQIFHSFAVNERSCASSRIDLSRHIRNTTSMGYKNDATNR